MGFASAPMPSNKWVCSIAPRLPEPVDALDLTDARYLAIVTDADGLAALPAVREPDGLLRRAGPGNGVAEALLALMARTYRLLVFAGRKGKRSWPSGPPRAAAPSSVSGVMSKPRSTTCATRGTPTTLFGC
jgi:hypothetical protein